MTSAPEGTPNGVDPFRHIGLFYRDVGEYAAACAEFVEQALDAGDPALVAVPGRNGELIRGRLGAGAATVTFKDMARDGRNPGRIIPSVLLAFAGANPGRRVWIIGEPIWAGRDDIEYPACVVHEALINAAFAGREASILCPYDASALAARALADAARTHPLVGDVNATWASPAYRDPVETAAMFDLPLPDPPRDAAPYTFRGTIALPAVRAFVAEHATAAGLRDQRLEEVLVAVNELATNTAEYTDEPGMITAWVENGSFVCQLDDFGRITDPLAGRVPPTDSATRGRGLLIVNELADLVRLHHRPSGTSIRVHFGLPACPDGPGGGEGQVAAGV
ncbi:sensor histidine kinase [Sphaerisporangium fuscum]|uniref:sensor histidine kinase n=1 Tax=Sphaerisporangium fuscum TaxID=2835868 RepID=UPI001BDCBD48|nr:sensor histidine kinase [Sphaerisporangium fuscum]